jgi:peptide/nickel transport system substrate-binding protein
MPIQKKVFITAFVVILCVCFFINFTLPAPALGQPVKGGILKAIRPTFPKVIGYRPEFAPVDTMFALPVIERLNQWDEKGNPIPVLAENWKGDPVNKTITWYLRKGVKFHDGTDWDAEACRWNLQLQIDTKSLPDGPYVKSLEVIDKYTIKMYLTEYTRLLTQENYGWAMMVSPTAFNKAGGGDIEKSKEWARKNSVGTGPFKVVDFKRDAFIKYERNDNYWRKGMPYLDGMELRFIPDPMTASAMMEAKEADAWHDVAFVRNVLDLEQKGFKVVWGPGMFWAILPNSNDPKSPFANKKVREAIEYALDRPAIAKMVGYGKYEPLHQIAPSKWPGYVPGYNPRPYNPDKAKKLLAEAGYPNGFKTAMLATEWMRDGATAIKSYLEAVGIDARLDIADMGRYFGAVFGTGWSDLVFAASGINPSTTDLFIHFGPEPMTYRTGTIKKSPEYLALCKEALHIYDDAKYIEKIKQIVKKAGEDAMVIPVYVSAQANVMQPYVHSNYVKIHSVIWYSYEDWLEKH